MKLHANTAAHSSVWDKLYWLFVGLYAFCIVYKSSMPLMSGDDIVFYASLVQGRDAWHGLDVNVGRFFPLAGWNLNLIASFSTSPYAFMIGNAIVFVLIAFCFFRLSLYTKAHRALVLVSFVSFALTVGYTKIITQIPFPENTQILFLCVFLLAAYRFYTKLSHNATDIYIYICDIDTACRKLRHLSQRSVFYPH